MKTLRLSFVLIAAMTAISVWAQTIDFVFVTKLRDYEQTSTADPALVANPYLVGAHVDGIGLDINNPASPTVTVPAGSQTLITLTLDGDEWEFESSGYADQNALNAAYGSGTYLFQSTSFSDISLSLSNLDLYPNAPKATISTNTGLGIMWTDNVLEVNPNLFTTLTVTTNVFADNFNSLSNHIGISGDGFASNVDAESFNSATDSLSLDIAAATFLGGFGSKSIEMEFNNLITMLADTPTTGAESISAFTSVTTFQIQVIPEPSTYAAILGALALTGVAIHRRRRAA